MDESVSIPLAASGLLHAITLILPSTAGGSTINYGYSPFVWRILLCSAFSFFFSGLEAGLLSTSVPWLNEKIQSGDKRAQKIQEILRNPSRLISVMLTMETTSNVVLAVLWTSVGLMLQKSYNLPPWTLIVWNAVLLFWIVTFLEITPKAIFSSNYRTILPIVATSAHFFVLLIHPIVIILEFLSRTLIFLRTGKWSQVTITKVTEEDLMTMVTVGETEGVLIEQEREIIHSIFEFGDLVAREIMVPRIDMVAIDIDTPVQSAIETIIASGHSRIPVYEETQDHIRGILYAKDLLRFIESGTIGNLSVKEIMRKDVLYVPETRGLTSLLEEMQSKKAHIAIVLDEYGGTAGLVSIEDILEEIVGEIQDEYDAPIDEPLVKNPDGTFIVDGKLGLHDFDDEIDVSLAAYDGIETVGGLILHVLGRVPVEGEKVEVLVTKEKSDDELEPENGSGNEIMKVEFKILEVDDQRIGKMHAVLIDEKSDNLNKENGEEVAK